MRHLKEFNADDFSMDDIKDLNAMGFQKLKGWCIYYISEEGYAGYYLVCEENEEKAVQRLPEGTGFFKRFVGPGDNKLSGITRKMIHSGDALSIAVYGPFEVKPDVTRPLFAAGPGYNPAYMIKKLEKYFVDPIKVVMPDPSEIEYMEEEEDETIF